MPVAVIIDWYGPYNSLERFKQEAKEWGKTNILYMAAENGNLNSEVLKVNYIGLSTSPATRFSGHKKIEDESNKYFYLAEITSAGVPGRRSKKTPTALDAAEGALIFALQPSQNQKRKTKPEDCVVVYSRFFGKNNPDKPKPTPAWFPAVVAYNSWSQEWVTR